MKVTYDGTIDNVIEIFNKTAALIMDQPFSNIGYAQVSEQVMGFTLNQ